MKDNWFTNNLIKIVFAVFILSGLLFIFYGLGRATSSSISRQSSKSSSSSNKMSSSSISSSSLEEITDSQIDNTLENMTVQQRAALIILGAPSNFEVAGGNLFEGVTADSLLDVNHIYTDSFGNNYEIDGLTLRFVGDNVQTFTFRNMVETKHVQNPSTTNHAYYGIQRNGVNIIYGSVTTPFEFHGITTISMRDLFRQYKDDSRLNRIAEKIYPE